MRGARVGGGADRHDFAAGTRFLGLHPFAGLFGGQRHDPRTDLDLNRSDCSLLSSARSMLAGAHYVKRFLRTRMCVSASCRNAGG